MLGRPQQRTALLQCLDLDTCQHTLPADSPALWDLVKVLVELKTDGRRTLLQHLSKPGLYTAALPFKTVEHFERWLHPEQVWQEPPSFAGCCHMPGCRA